MSAGKPQLIEAKIAPALLAEFPELTFTYGLVAANTRRSPKYVREQLAHLSDKLVGDRAVNLRREPLAHAYRVFFRQIGLDPDRASTPIEAVFMERLRGGRFASGGLLVDALTVAIVESGIALGALDASTIEQPVGLRLSEADERWAGDPVPLPSGTIVIADARRPLTPIFGSRPPDAVLPDGSTEQVLLYAVGVAGVPQVLADEALWKCAEALAAAL